MYMGYLAHKTPRPLRSLQKNYAKGPMEVLEGRRFLMSEVPLYIPDPELYARNPIPGFGMQGREGVKKGAWQPPAT